MLRTLCCSLMAWCASLLFPCSKLSRIPYSKPSLFYNTVYCIHKALTGCVKVQKINIYILLNFFISQTLCVCFSPKKGFFITFMFKRWRSFSNSTIPVLYMSTVLHRKQKNYVCGPNLPTTVSIRLCHM